MLLKKNEILQKNKVDMTAVFYCQHWNLIRKKKCPSIFAVTLQKSLQC